MLRRVCILNCVYAVVSRDERCFAFERESESDTFVMVAKYNSNHMIITKSNRQMSLWGLL